MAAVELEHVHSEESFILAICSHGEASVGNLVCRLQRACTRSTVRIIRQPHDTSICI